MRDHRKLPTFAEAEAIYAVLVEEAEAINDIREQHAFAHYLASTEHAEWRFCGSLGYGGKLHNTPYREPYVTCYPEHTTPDRSATIERCNARLKALHSSKTEETGGSDG